MMHEYAKVVDLNLVSVFWRGQSCSTPKRGRDNFVLVKVGIPIILLLLASLHMRLTFSSHLIICTKILTWI